MPFEQCIKTYAPHRESHRILAVAYVRSRLSDRFDANSIEIKTLSDQLNAASYLRSIYLIAIMHAPHGTHKQQQTLQWDEAYFIHSIYKDCVI